MCSSMMIKIWECECWAKDIWAALWTLSPGQHAHDAKRTMDGTRQKKRCTIWEWAFNGLWKRKGHIDIGRILYKNPAYSYCCSSFTEVHAYNLKKNVLAYNIVMFLATPFFPFNLAGWTKIHGLTNNSNVAIGTDTTRMFSTGSHSKTTPNEPRTTSATENAHDISQGFPPPAF